MSGLLYQVVWVRQFGNLFGNTVFSAAAVSGGFLGGLGLGSYLVGRWIDRQQLRGGASPLRWYGLFELAIGVLGLAVALTLPALEGLSSSVSSYEAAANGWYELSAGSHLFRYAIAAALLTPITVLMGGTLPLLIRHLVARDLSLAGWHVGWLYGINTLGAALGAFLTDFSLIPSLGILGTQLVAVGINLVAGAGALTIAALGERTAVERTAAGDAPAGDRRADGRVALWTGVALFLSGTAAIGMEILWFRFLVSALGPFRAVFSLLLTVILIGICIGSLLGGWLHRRLGNPVPLFMAAQVFFVLATLLEFASFDPQAVRTARAALGDWYRSASPLGQAAINSWANLRPILSLVLLPALAMGLGFPLANANAQRAAERVGSRAGGLYLANTLGNVAGSLLAGFVLLPWLGVQRGVAVLAVVAALALLPLHRSTRGSTPAESSSARRSLALCAPTLVLALLAWGLLLPEQQLARVAVPSAPGADRIVLALSEGVNDTVAVVDEPGVVRRLLINGVANSGTDGLGGDRYMRLFVHVPLLQMEDPRDVLVICFGVGNTLHAASLHESVERLEVVDLSRNVVSRAPLFSDFNGDILTHPKLSVFINDGRQHLRMRSEQSYDLITLEPPPINTAGIASLYSVEFYELARSRLRPGGHLTQWLPVYQVPGDTVLSMIRAFLDVFPGAVLLSGDQRELILMGARDSEPRLDPARAAARIEANPRLARDLRNSRVESLTSLVATFVADSGTLEQATAGHAPVTDDWPIMEYGARGKLFESTLPHGIVQTSEVTRWCPDCFRDGRPIPELADLPLYLGALERCYRSERFRHFSQVVHRADRYPPVRLPRDPELERVVSEDAYLRVIFRPPGLGADDSWPLAPCVLDGHRPRPRP